MGRRPEPITFVLGYGGSCRAALEAGGVRAHTPLREGFRIADPVGALPVTWPAEPEGFETIAFVPLERSLRADHDDIVDATVVEARCNATMPFCAPR